MAVAPTNGQQGTISSTPGAVTPLTAISTSISTGIRLKALSTNSGTVYVGFYASAALANTAVTGLTTTTGFPLTAGNEISIDAGLMKTTAFAGYGDLLNVYLLASGASQVVAYYGI